ncbi:helix-turn-helix transcriptional regulator [Rheinheimera sp. MMS21-TC3]|uniref:helix-turn-helix transcriptional regulator n=1 Tax=unclassified Rheinheimera TaxID=115860 RepID=UPI0028C47250|nr:helix-turn-helix transcriptional regulator [Rheinheimera sp. MMS21-TC3]WNO59921.1 helix-turn-helix transcriptional regulator [Rheinheimera sp. MMS21-TC3]
MQYPVLTIAQLKLYIKALRNKLGYTQANAGELLGLTQQGYQRLENNPESMSVERLLVLLQTLQAGLVIEVRTKPEDNIQSSTAISEPKNIDTRADNPSNQSKIASESNNKSRVLAVRSNKKLEW